METKKVTFSHRTPEEVRAWFNRRKAWYQEVEERAHAMYKEEQRLSPTLTRKYPCLMR